MQKLLYRADATWRVFFIGALYRLASPKTVIQWCGRRQVSRYGSIGAPDIEDTFKWSVRLSAKFFKNPCLIHATTIYWMFPKARLFIGLKPVEAGAEAHAWIEADGKLMSTVATEHYSKLMAVEGRP